MKILLLGAGGRLGRELARSLAPHGSIVGCVRTGSPAVTKEHCRQVDLASPDDLRAVVREVRPDLIVNAAAYTAVEAAEREQAAALAINGTAPGVLAEEAGRLGAALVHYSTDYVFGGAGTHPWREEDSTAPLNAYGRSKLAGEMAIRSSGAAYLIVRTSWLYAACGASFATRMLDLARQQGEIPMVSDQIGAPTSARFVANATARIVGQADDRPASLLRERGGTLHVVCAGETSWYGYAVEIFEQARELGLPIAIPTLRPILSAERPAALARPLNSRLDATRLAERFDIQPPAWQEEFRLLAPDLFRQYLQKTGAGGASS